MPDVTDKGSDSSAERAYAEAVGAMPVDVPAKAERARQPAGAAIPGSSQSKEAEPVAETKPVAEVPVIEPKAVEPAAAPVVEAPARAAKAPFGAKPASKAPAPEAKPAVARKVSKPRTVKPAKAAKRVAPARPAAAKGASVAPKAASKPATVPNKPIALLKEKIMTAKTADFTAPLKSVIDDFQKQAKTAYDKSAAIFGEAGEFAKGNVDAIIESGKILAAGVQDLGKDYVAETKAAIETLTADVKQLAAVKSPAELLKLQGDMLRRNIDSAIAFGSKNSEAVLKLANEAFAPISSRVTLAVEKLKKAA